MRCPSCAENTIPSCPNCDTTSNEQIANEYAFMDHAKQLADLARRMERLEDGFADPDRIGGFRRLEDSILTERAARKPKYTVEDIKVEPISNNYDYSYIRCKDQHWGGEWRNTYADLHHNTDASIIAQHLRANAILPKEQA